MRLETEFIRLAVKVDSVRLTDEVRRIPEAAWRAHPQQFAGNSAIALIAVDGDPESDEIAGPMLPTPHLATCPYLTQVLHGLSTVLGRTRLMRIEGNAEAKSHSDINYYWFERARVHVPIVTHPDVTFHCGNRSLHMAGGEAWIFDTWRPHRVLNPRETDRIHLVADTVGSAAFWSMVDASRRGDATDREIAFDAAARPQLECESWNWPRIMAPAEVEAIVAQLCGALPRGGSQASAVERLLLAFVREWRSLWARCGDAPASTAHYAAARTQLAEQLAPHARDLVLENDARAESAIDALLLQALVARAGTPPITKRKPAREHFERPVFIVCPPRSGSSLLFETLAQSPELWTIGGEAHRIIETVPELHPAHTGYASNRLTAEAARPEVVAQLRAAFFSQLRDRDGQAPAPGRALRMLEKTPKNALRVPFLAQAFPDARFIYLYRDPRETLSSMLDAWRSERFVTYRELPGWQGPPWSLLLIPGWRELSGRPLPEIVAQQWLQATQTLLADLGALPPETWCVASYDRLVAEPRQEIERICNFVTVRWDRPLEAPLRLSRTTLSSPAPDKWRRNASELDAMLPRVQDVAENARQLFARPPTSAAVARKTSATGSSEPDFRSSYTKNFPELLASLGVTLVASTYQSGRVVLVREDGGRLNTHLRAFESPMGIALAGGRLALGTRREIWEFFDMPALAPKLREPRRPDAVYIPRTCSITGDVRVHELAYAAGELWFVNTRFSALCTLDREHSFVPRWQPPFVSALTPEDRCHLNGLCVVDGAVRYVTALGASDEAGGWREGKLEGGGLLEVPSGRVIVGGLCMPHSPRWHDGELWVLESGRGELGRVDLATQRVRPCARLDGFTRGLAFAGPYAFVGLSQVRESNVFGGIPLLERAHSPRCGIWVVDTRNGDTVAFLRFEGAVQEIFDVRVLERARFAELLEPGNELLTGSYALPRDVLHHVPERFTRNA